MTKQPTRHELQAKGEHPAPCARFCEATAFRIAERGLHRRIDELTAQLNAKQKQEQVACLGCGSNNIGIPANYDSLISSVKTKQEHPIPSNSTVLEKQEDWGFGPHEHHSLSAKQERVAETGGKVHEVVAWMFQHEETGRIAFVEAQQLEWGFEKGNPRLKKIGALYLHPPELAATERQVEILTDEQSCSESLKVADKAWVQFCGGIGRGPDAPYPGMIEAFELHYGQSFTDKDWRAETSVWAAAWKSAKSTTQEPKQEQGEPVYIQTRHKDAYGRYGEWSNPLGPEHIGSR